MIAILIKRSKSIDRKFKKDTNGPYKIKESKDLRNHKTCQSEHSLAKIQVYKRPQSVVEVPKLQLESPHFLWRCKISSIHTKFYLPTDYLVKKRAASTLQEEYDFGQYH